MKFLEITGGGITPVAQIEQMDTSGQTFALEQNVKYIKKDIEFKFLLMGQNLSLVLDHERWDPENYDSFVQWCAQPEIGFSKSTAYGLIDIYKTYVEAWGIEETLLCEVGSTKLKLLREKNVITKENALDQLHMAKTLSKRDLMSELGIITLNEQGYIECQLKESGTGFYLHVYQGNEKFAPGVYRLTKENISGSELTTICHFKGKIQEE